MNRSSTRSITTKHVPPAEAILTNRYKCVSAPASSSLPSSTSRIVYEEVMLGIKRAYLDAEISKDAESACEQARQEAEAMSRLLDALAQGALPPVE